MNNTGFWFAIAAGITGIFALLGVVLTAYIAVWQKRHIGSSNGNGPANYMLEKVLWQQGITDLRFSKLFEGTGINDPAAHGEEVAEAVRVAKAIQDVADKKEHE